MKATIRVVAVRRIGMVATMSVKRVASGIYFYELAADDISLLRKMVIFKVGVSSESVVGAVRNRTYLGWGKHAHLFCATFKLTTIYIKEF